jgi:prophage antirepressor-like protein
MSIVKVFESVDIRFVQHPEGKYDFGVVAVDLAGVLEMDVSQASKMPVDDDWKGSSIITTLGGNQAMTVIWEPGVYELLSKSRKPKAKPFKKWLFEEVLPTIRKTGSYSVQHKIPQTYAEALLEAGRLALENERLSAKIEQDAPLVAYAEAVQCSADSLELNEFAKLIGTGRTRLFRLMRDLGVIMQTSTLPYQRWLDAGYFELDQEVSMTDGKLRPYARVTGKGQVWLKQKIDAHLAQQKQFAGLLVQGVLGI